MPNTLFRLPAIVHKLLEPIPVSDPLPSLSAVTGKLRSALKNPETARTAMEAVGLQLQQLLHCAAARYLSTPIYEMKVPPTEIGKLTLRDLRHGIMNGTISPHARVRIRPEETTGECPKWTTVADGLRKEKFLIADAFHPVLASVVLGMAAYGLLWLSAWILVPLFAAIHPILMPLGMALPVLSIMPVAANGLELVLDHWGRVQTIPSRLQRGAAACAVLAITCFVALQVAAWNLLWFIGRSVYRLGMLFAELTGRQNSLIRVFGFVCFYAYLLAIAPGMIALLLFLGGTICFGALAGGITGLGRYAFRPRSAIPALKTNAGRSANVKRPPGTRKSAKVRPSA